ncbi:unnamed protein product [Brachionus calyciflorus]|uniref:Uncharacterized protein n=1 Tax=Brachionus calyciflorus TaxID=104777 RepID=A0A814CFC4_9BILA|nr:unnamed protein product [Brachionus calyciflorus]
MNDITYIASVKIISVCDKIKQPIFLKEDILNYINLISIESGFKYEFLISPLKAKISHLMSNSSIMALKTTGRGRSKIIETRAKPYFAIELWSIHSRLMQDIPRTTNLVESWHNAFCKMLTSHPCVYDLVDWFRKEIQRTNDNLIKFRTGVRTSRNQEKLIIDKRVR